MVFLPKNHLITEMVATQRFNTHSYAHDLNLTQEQMDELRKIIVFHRGQNYVLNNNTSSAPSTSSPSPSVSPTTIHIHHHYHRDYWYDWYIWNALSMDSYHYHRHEHNHNHYHHHTSSHTSTHKKEDDENNAAQIILATLVVAAAVIASLYVAIEAGRCIDQLAHAEDIFGNMCRLAMTAFGGALGVGSGLLFGASVLSMPILGAVCGCLVFSGLAIAASKKIIAAVHTATNDASALAYDPRFCLSEKEAAYLDSQGYDVFAVREAIRALAIVYDDARKNAGTLMFWGAGNREKAACIDDIRLLKQGWDINQKTITIGTKQFDLNKVDVEFTDEAPVVGIPLEVANDDGQPMCRAKSV